MIVSTLIICMYEACFNQSTITTLGNIGRLGFEKCAIRFARHHESIVAEGKTCEVVAKEINAETSNTTQTGEKGKL